MQCRPSNEDSVGRPRSEDLPVGDRPGPARREGAGHPARKARRASAFEYAPGGNVAGRVDFSGSLRSRMFRFDVDDARRGASTRTRGRTWYLSTMSGIPDVASRPCRHGQSTSNSTDKALIKGRRTASTANACTDHPHDRGECIEIGTAFMAIANGSPPTDAFVARSLPPDVRPAEWCADASHDGRRSEPAARGPDRSGRTIRAPITGERVATPHARHRPSGRSREALRYGPLRARTGAGDDEAASDARHVGLATGRGRCRGIVGRIVFRTLQWFRSNEKRAMSLSLSSGKWHGRADSCDGRSGICGSRR